MNLRKSAFIVTIMAVAWLTMFVTSPISGSMASVISIVFDRMVGQTWQTAPIINLAPVLIVWMIYCVAIIAFIYVIGKGGSGNYPPVDEQGRPMIACFGRSTSFRRIRRHDADES